MINGEIAIYYNIHNSILKTGMTYPFRFCKYKVEAGSNK